MNEKVLRRFMRHVVIDEETGCWVWMGSRDRDGYGVFKYKGKMWRVNRFVWTMLRGEIPPGLVVDHQCNNRACANVEHLKPMTIGENVLRSTETIAGKNMRKTSCIHGHPFDTENTYVHRGKRYCKTCFAERETSRRRKKAGEKRA